MKLGFLPFALLVVPVVEIAVFITIGGEIGLWPTVGMVVLTAILGTFLLRHQGFQVVSEIRKKTEAGEIPGRELVHGVILLIAGVLLLTPGFVTDTLGFVLFIPSVRDSAWHFLKSRIQVNVMPPMGMQGTPPPSSGPTIDLDETEFGPTNTNSPWNDKSR